MTNSTHCSAATLGKLLDLTERRIRQLAREDIIPKVKSGQYDMVGGIRGYLKHMRSSESRTLPDYQQQKARHSRLKSDLLELRLAREKKQLISAKAVDDAWCDITIRAREILLGMAPGLAAKIILLKNVDDITDCIDQEVETVLALLANPDYNDDFTMGKDLEFEINEEFESEAD